MHWCGGVSQALLAAALFGATLPAADDVSLIVSTPKAAYYLGEVIPLQLAFRWLACLLRHRLSIPITRSICDESGPGTACH